VITVANEFIRDFKLIENPESLIQPLSITDDWTSLICYHFAELDKVVNVKGKEKMVKENKKVPLMIVWDGKKIHKFICEEGREIELNDEKYIIDRDIHQNPMLPSESFISKLCNNDIKTMKMIEEFDPKEYFQAVLEYMRYYFHWRSPMLPRILALYAINCTLFDAFDSVPYLYIRSPEMGCGKSHLGQSISQMTNGLVTTGSRANHVFRLVHGEKTLIVFEEVKKKFTGKMSEDAEDLLSLINAGFQRDGSKVTRSIEKTGGRKGDFEIRLYDSYSPKIIISTHLTIPDDTQSRCIPIMMQKAPTKGTDYGERWNQRKKRIAKLKKIREMGYLFRLKYGSEIKKLSENDNWRDELDIKKILKNVKNRELEVFRPLAMLCFKFMPDWDEEIAKFINKNMEMRQHIRAGLTSAVLSALKEIYQLCESYGGEYVIVDRAKDGTEKELKSVLKETQYGNTLYVPIKAIAKTIEDTTDMINLGKNPNSRIGMKLNDLGFLESRREDYGMVRIIRGIDLSDQCEAYLGTPIGTYDDDYELSHSEKINLVRESLMQKVDGLTWSQLLTEVDEQIPEDELKNSLIPKLKEDGRVIIFGKRYQWIE